MNAKLNNFKEAKRSPCLTCQNVPCCSHLPLKELKASTLLHIDEIRFYLNFQNIRITLNNRGLWKIYYHQACRFFNAETRFCTIHGREEQPNVCVHYNPYKCYYKKIDEAKVHYSEEIIWMNPKRLDHLQNFLLFDEHRNICAWPETTQLFKELSKIPYEETSYPGSDYDETLDQWKKNVKGSNNTLTGPINPGKPGQARNPCANCQAYCCTTLVFPMNAPANFSTLDFYKYCLGFRGVQLGISNRNWSVIVRSRCTHLTEDRKCALFGKEERPLLCQYYDAGNCGYKKEFEPIRPAGYMRVTLNEFNWILQTYQFDNQGNIISQQDVEGLRQHIEQKWNELVKF